MYCSQKFNTGRNKSIFFSLFNLIFDLICNGQFKKENCLFKSNRLEILAFATNVEPETIKVVDKVSKQYRLCIF